MRVILFCLLVVIGLESCNTQQKSSPKKIFNKEFNWTIEVPSGFESVPPEQWAKMQNRGVDAIEKTYEGKVENRAKTIFVFKSDQFNYFEANYQPFDTAKDGDYLESCQNVNKLMYGTLEAQASNAVFDSSSTVEKIDGKTFQVFKVTMTVPDKLVMDFLMYSRLFGNKEFSVNIMTANKDKEKILLDAWKNSRFN